MCLSPQQMLLELMVACGKDGKVKVIKVPFAIGAGKRCVHFELFRKWSPERGRDSHVRGKLLVYMCEWSLTLNNNKKNEWLK